MNRKAIVTKTAKGMREACGATRSLGRDLKAFLKAVDGKSTPDDLAARLGKPYEAAFGETLERLMAEGYIQEIPLGTGDEWDLDFTSADIQREIKAEARRKAEETARRWAAERARRRAEERERREAEKRAKCEAEERARREAEEARKLAEAQAKRAAEERARQEAEALAKREAEEKMRREAEARAMREAEERAKRAAEEAARKAAAERAQREAEEQARRKAEEDRRAAEAEAKRAAEERARQEAEAQAKREAEEQARRAAEERARKEAEALAKREAEERERREAEERIRLEAEARALSAAREHVRLAAETIASREADHHAWSEIGQQNVRPADEAPRIEVAAQASRESVAREGRAARKRREREERQERREREAARREAEARSTRHAERELREARAAIADKPVLKRVPVRWGRPLALALLVLLTAGLLLLHLMPFDGQRARFENLAGEQFQHPVSIRAVHFSLLPRPHWNLDGVTIGNGRQVQAPRVRLIVGTDALLHDAAVFETVEVDAPVLTEEGLGWLLLGKAHGRGFSVARVEARGAVLQAKNFALPSFDVHAEWGDDGNWRKMQLGFAGTDLTVRLAPADDAVEFSLQSLAFAPPFLPGLPVLGDFNAEGTARRGELQVTRFDGRVHGGIIAGSARLRFDGDPALEGEVNAKGIDMVKLIPGLFEDGQLDGAATFVLPVPEAGKPGPAPRMAGSFAVRRGVLAGIDMGSALKNNSLGGRTRFSRLEGTLAVENGGVQLRRLQLDAGAMSAKGNVDVAADGSLNGRIDVALAAAAVRRHVVLHLSGAFNEPYLKNADWTRR